MSQEAKSPTTFEKSCQHWSEASASEMDAFYRLATYDYTLLAKHSDWAEELTRLSRTASSATLSLLDVACGSGKFPAALLANDAFQSYAGKPIDYHLLDPSAFSLQEAEAELRPPFHPGQSFHCTLQDYESTTEHDVVWATHALYCVPAEELSAAAARFCSAIRLGGMGFIAHATENAHYLRFQQLYLDHWPSAAGAPFSTAKQVAAALQEEGKKTYGAEWHWEESTIDYEGTLPLDDDKTAEMYLQRCLFDDGITLDEMLAHPTLGEYLREKQDHAAGLWRFPQHTTLMRFGGNAPV